MEEKRLYVLKAIHEGVDGTTCLLEIDRQLRAVCDVDPKLLNLRQRSPIYARK